MMLEQIRDKRILITGGGGFLGREVISRLAAWGCRRVHVARSKDHDLMDPRAALHLFSLVRPEVVIHLAARMGGIGFNSTHPATSARENALLGINVLEECRRWGVEKVLTAGSVCAYPLNCPVPYREEDLWSGYPEPSNGPYGQAKRMVCDLGRAYRSEHGLRVVHLLFGNLYGPGDNFDLETSHVIPALIRKMVEAVEAGRDVVPAWGSGMVSREFVHVRDAARAACLAADRYDGNEPTNVGSGREVIVRDLASMIADVTGFRGRVEWDLSRPEGQPRRRLDVSRAADRFGFRAEIPLEDGIQETVEWFRSHREGKCETQTREQG